MTNPNHSNPDNLLSNGVSVERKRLTAKQKGIAVLAAASLLATLGTGCSGQKTVGELTKPPVVEAPINPDDVIVPKEAEGFVIAFGTRYEDPVSTYYAVKSYSEKTGIGSIMSNETIEAYDAEEEPHFEKSFLGFEAGRMPLGKEIAREDTIKFFNEYQANNMSMYMNYLSKNPGPEAKSVIDSEFLFYSAGPEVLVSSEVLARTENLIATLTSVVDKYGSNTNYNVQPAVSSDFGREKFSTLFNSNIRTRVQGDKNEIFVDSAITLVIEVEIFEGDKSNKTEERIEGFQQTIVRQPNVLGSEFSYVSWGEDK